MISGDHVVQPHAQSQVSESRFLRTCVLDISKDGDSLTATLGNGFSDLKILQYFFSLFLN